MDQRPEDAAAEPDAARQAARQAIERYLLSRELHWERVAEEAEAVASPDIEGWQKSWVDARQRLFQWQTTGKTDNNTTAEAVQRAWDEVKQLRSSLQDKTRDSGYDELREEHNQRRHQAELIEKGARLLGYYDIEVDRPPLLDDPDANG